MRNSSKRTIFLAIDDGSLPVKKNLCLHLARPTVRAAPVLSPSPRGSGAPDNLAAHFYGTVRQDGDGFRMWYYACHWGRNPDWPAHLQRQLAKWTDDYFIGPLCYAESDDGIHWRKPALGQVLFKGSRDNNALALPHTPVSSATVIRDDDDPDPQRRYKMVYEFMPDWTDPPIDENGSTPTVATAVSPDGLQWRAAGIPYRNEFAEQSSFYKHGDLYVINAQSIATCLPGEGGAARGRQGFARFSYDFDEWIDGHVESFTLPEPRDPGRRGSKCAYDQVHLGVGATSLGNVCVGLYGLWHSADFDNEFPKISCDLGLVVSNDGLRFREPVKGHVFLAREDSLVTPCPGKDYNTILCQANGILNVGDQTRIYHGRWRNSGMAPGEAEDYRGEVALATIPRDRWGGLGLFPRVAEGCVWSAPVTLPKGRATVTLNADGADAVRVEVADERFGLLPGLHGEDAATTDSAGGLDCALRWAHAGGLAPLAGRTVRLKVTVTRRPGPEPRLYAMEIGC